MRKLIVLVCIILSLNSQADEGLLEPSWKSTLRNFITKIMGENISVRLLGESPKPIPQILMPVIPKDLKQSTSIESYSKLTKGPTAFDQLPSDRKAQFDYQFLRELFLVTRKVEAKDEDLSNWLNVLEQGGSREGIYQALVLDDVYAALENLEDKSSSQLTEFCVKFAQKYLGQTFKLTSLEHLNLFSLKRIFTEKAIDLMAYWESKDLDALYRWYAIFSAEVAAMNHTFQSDLRKNTSVEVHYAWAKEMPIQHIKSEFIIKLHIIMNGL